MVLVTNFLTKVAPKLCNHLGYFDVTLLSNFCSGSFLLNVWPKLGYFLFQHLVTLLTESFRQERSKLYSLSLSHSTHWPPLPNRVQLGMLAVDYHIFSEMHLGVVRTRALKTGNLKLIAELLLYQIGHSQYKVAQLFPKISQIVATPVCIKKRIF